MGLIQTDVIVDAYRKSMGDEGAKHLISEAVVEVGLRPAESYSSADTKAILEHLKGKGGLTMVVASGIAVRLLFSGELKDRSDRVGGQTQPR